MKTRFVFSAFCMLVAMTMATGAFAQAVFTVSSGNQPRGRLNGHTEVAGGVTLAKLSGTSVGVGGGSVIIDYGVPITNAVNATGAATADTTDIEVNICGAPITATSAVVTKNTITVTVAAAGCGDDGGDAGDAIDVSGVRLSLAGSGQTGIVATVSSTGGVRLPSGSNQVSVINSIVDELVDDGVTAETLTLIRHTGSPEDGEYFKLLIEENAVDSFAGAALDLDFSGVGTGMTVTLDAWVSTKEDLDDLKPVEFVLLENVEDTDADESEDNVFSNQQLAFEGGTGSSDTLTADITALNNSARVLMDLGGVFRNEDGDLVDDDTTAGINEADIMGGGLDPAKIDVIVIRGKIALTTTGDNAVELPLTLDIMANATVSPIGAAIPPKTGDPERGIPRFASDPSHTVTVIDSTSDQTMLRVAYVLSNGPYDTGIGVSNMTDGKSAQTGAVHFDLYMNGQRIGPATADYSYSTSMLGPQSTMSMLLTEVLTGAGHTGRFGGYMIITTDFNEADAGVFISDFAGFTAAATVREIP
jgi:hypothetical protein